MRKWLKVVIAVILVAVVGVILLLLPEREPSYEGKRLSEWLVGFYPDRKDYRPLDEQPQHIKAANAVRQIGTNAAPTLLRMLRASDSSLKLQLLRLASKQKLIKVHYTSAGELNMLASMAFGSLEGASNTVPELIDIYRENRSEYSQNAVVLALRSIGPPAELAVPCLIDAAATTNFAMRHNALAALGEIHARPELVVPVLTNALRDPDAMVRGAAACGLRDFGERAKSAVPALLELLKDKDQYASSLAADALEQIDPEATAEARAGYKSRWQ